MDILAAITEILKWLGSATIIAGGLWKGMEAASVAFGAAATAISEALKRRADAQLEARKLEHQIAKDSTNTALTAMQGTITSLTNRVDVVEGDLETERQARRNDRSESERKINRLKLDLKKHQRYIVILQQKLRESGMDIPPFPDTGELDEADI